RRCSSEMLAVRLELKGRGRDEDYSSPPAQIPACAANAPGSSLGFWRRSGDKAAWCSVLIGGKKRATSRMNLSQVRPAVWLRRLSDASQSRFTLLRNHHRLGRFPATAK